MNQSPTPNEVEIAETELPKCHCGELVKQVRYVDYDAIRVVVHTGKNCVLGVVNIL